MKKLDNVIDKHSLPITCNSKILQHIVDIQTKSYINKTKSLSVSLDDELYNLFGKETCVLVNQKCYCLEYNNLTYNVFTKKGKGTSIEVNLTYEDLNKRKNVKNILEFLKELYKSINK